MDHVLASRNEYKCSGGVRSKFYANQDILDLDLLNLSNIEILKCEYEKLHLLSVIVCAISVKVIYIYYIYVKVGTSL